MNGSRRPAWLPAVAAVCFGALTLSLGNWQLHRADAKRGLQARFDRAAGEAPLEVRSALSTDEQGLFRHVRLHGQYDARHQIYLDNRILDGRAGYHVITPLRYGQEGLVLVNRGWLAAEDRRASPDARVPAGEVTIEGIVTRARQRYFELSANTVAGAVWQNLDLDRYRAHVGAALPDALILQLAGPDDGLVRRWPRPDTGVAMHQGYALQWFALSATIAVLYGYFWMRKRWSRGA